MLTKEDILAAAKRARWIKTSDISSRYKVSRQYAARLISELVKDGQLKKSGETRSAIYELPTGGMRPVAGKGRFKKRYKNKGLEEHKILEEVESSFESIRGLPENVKSIFIYAFLEMLNNAIEHSRSKYIAVEVSFANGDICFLVSDSGIGVFRNIMNKRKLSNTLESIRELLKGKLTTAPKLHSGEGIFFTSKAGDEFILSSFGDELMVDNKLPDIFVGQSGKAHAGTKVSFKINTKSDAHLNDVFKKFTDENDGDGFGFDKTEIRVRLYAMGGVHISRSQARRILSGLDKFRVVIMDYDKVPMVGQAFADEVYRVFKEKHPEIKIENINMNDAVKFMVERVRIK